MPPKAPPGKGDPPPGPGEGAPVGDPAEKKEDESFEDEKKDDKRPLKPKGAKTSRRSRMCNNFLPK